MKNFILFFFLTSLNCYGGTRTMDRDHELGYQLGYFTSRSNTIDVGMNYYWSINKSGKTNLYAHNFGPFVCADINFVKGVTYIGERIGFDYHFLDITSLRISPAIEHFAKNDVMLGADIGFSFSGIFFYYGYYAPIGKEELEGVSPHRFGIRLVFNEAPINTTPFD